MSILERKHLKKDNSEQEESEQQSYLDRENLKKYNYGEAEFEKEEFGT